MPAVQLTQDAGPLGDLPQLARRLEEIGFQAAWLGEVNGSDVVVPATIVASNTTSLSVGSLFNVFTRSPTNVAMAAAGLSQLAPARTLTVLGASSPLLVERWNGIPYERPYARVRDYLRFLKDVLAGERISREFSTFRSRGFSLSDPPAVVPDVLVAAAMPRSIALGSEEADGVVLNWVAPHDLDRLQTLTGDRSRVWLSLVVCPSPDRTEVDRIVRPLMSDYLSAPSYAGLQRQVGRGGSLEAMWDRFAAGDRDGARAQLPSAVIDELVVSGDPQQCGRALRDIEADLGVHAIATLYLPSGLGYLDALDQMRS